ncbi:hypothetical protein M316_0050 [Nitrincola phage 1M3-16]|uniref:hypothetical protein n=1 Tax=Nitrincola phage 1M3-16 TaxID=1472912 RepID=UPI000444C152|nr:hypothetical protein GJ22_gp102 [Nitrincola phage 1M3-16]AHX01115.1 hypothetical protein M316_0050 [Nitrincola phage 1M3-16]
MYTPPNKHNNLWNDLPTSERKRLKPHLLETQILHIWQCKQKAILAHKKHIKELDAWIENIEKELNRDITKVGGGNEG